MQHIKKNQQLPFSGQVAAQFQVLTFLPYWRGSPGRIVSILGQVEGFEPRHMGKLRA